MGLFEWFKNTPSNVTVLSDKIWLTKQAKFNGIMQAISHRLAEQDGPDAVILVAHFRDCFDELQQIVEIVGVSGPVTVATAEMLKSHKASGMSFDESQTIEILVGEHHPLLNTRLSLPPPPERRPMIRRISSPASASGCPWDTVMARKSFRQCLQVSKSKG